MSPHATSGGPGWDGHLLLLHRGEPERLGRLAAWMRHGLRQHEKILYVEPTDAGPESITVRLRDHGIDTDTLRPTRRLKILSPEAYFAVGGPETAIRAALAEGFPAVRISGTASTALSVVTETGHRDIEWGVDRLCRVWPVSALCQYTYPTDTGRLRAVLGMHPSGFRARRLAGSGTGSPLVLHGSVDTGDVEVLATLVDIATAGAAGAGLDRLRIDLTDIEHLTAPACRAVARAGVRFRGGGGILVLEGARPVVEQMLRTCGLAELPGIELTATES